MPFKKGQSGNPSGRPPKSEALRDLLTEALTKTVDTPYGKLSGKALVSHLVVEAITTGRVQFPGEEGSSVIGIKDWLEFVKWAYQYIDPPVNKNENKNSGEYIFRIVHDTKRNPNSSAGGA